LPTADQIKKAFQDAIPARRDAFERAVRACHWRLTHSDDQYPTHYLGFLKNGIGPPMPDFRLPHWTSTRWHDSFIVYLDRSRDAEVVVVDAIQQAQPI
jgi:hypothetical protein